MAKLLITYSRSFIFKSLVSSYSLVLFLSFVKRLTYSCIWPCLSLASLRSFCNCFSCSYLSSDSADNWFFCSSSIAIRSLLSLPSKIRLSLSFLNSSSYSFDSFNSFSTLSKYAKSYCFWSSAALISFCNPSFFYCSSSSFYSK